MRGETDGEGGEEGNERVHEANDSERVVPKVTGPKALPRSEVAKKLWGYIKEKNLQDKSNRRMINADEPLKPILGKPQVSMFEMTALVSKHLS